MNAERREENRQERQGRHARGGIEPGINRPEWVAGQSRH